LPAHVHQFAHPERGHVHLLSRSYRVLSNYASGVLLAGQGRKSCRFVPLTPDGIACALAEHLLPCSLATYKLVEVAS
jgi:hypothetical protein